MKRKFSQKMAGKVPVLVIAAVVLFAGTALAGCSQEEAEQATANTGEWEGSGETIFEETPSAEGPIYYAVTALSKEQKTMLGPMGALVYAYIDAGEETPTWANSGWPAVSELFNYWGTDYVSDNGQVTGDDSGIRISEDFLKEAASVMFPDYDGSLPTIDASEETAGFQPEEDGYYPYVFSDRGEGADDFAITSWLQNEDETCEVTVGATDYQGDTTSYLFTLTPIDDTDEESDSVFIYDVTGMEKEATP